MFQILKRSCRLKLVIEQSAEHGKLAFIFAWKFRALIYEVCSLLQRYIQTSTALIACR